MIRIATALAPGQIQDLDFLVSVTETVSEHPSRASLIRKAVALFLAQRLQDTPEFFDFIESKRGSDL